MQGKQHSSPDRVHCQLIQECLPHSKRLRLQTYTYIHIRRHRVICTAYVHIRVCGGFLVAEPEMNKFNFSYTRCITSLKRLLPKTNVIHRYGALQYVLGYMVES